MLFSLKLCVEWLNLWKLLCCSMWMEFLLLMCVLVFRCCRFSLLKVLFSIRCMVLLVMFWL